LQIKNLANNRPKILKWSRYAKIDLLYGLGAKNPELVYLNNPMAGLDTSSRTFSTH
jgi:hypothetical protein